MNKSEVIVGLNGIRHDMEKSGDTYGADVIAEATYMLIHDSIPHK